MELWLLRISPWFKGSKSKRRWDLPKKESTLPRNSLPSKWMLMKLVCLRVNSLNLFLWALNLNHQRKRGLWALKRRKLALFLQTRNLWRVLSRTKLPPKNLKLYQSLSQSGMTTERRVNTLTRALTLKKCEPAKIKRDHKWSRQSNLCATLKKEDASLLWLPIKRNRENLESSFRASTEMCNKLLTCTKTLTNLQLTPRSLTTACSNIRFRPIKTVPQRRSNLQQGSQKDRSPGKLKLANLKMGKSCRTRRILKKSTKMGCKETWES